MTAALFDPGDRGATISDDGLYRYELWRRWDDGPVLGFIMLNPSTADADQDDATIRRCIGFAKREGLAGITVRNLYAYRTPKPKVLEQAARDGIDVIGPDNDQWISSLAADRFGVRTIVAAWGACNGLRAVDPGRRIMAVFRLMVAAHRDLHALRGHDASITVRRGPPAAPHPLYLPKDTPLVRFADE